jgi:glycosyl transferase family 7 (putative galactosyltransferase)/glycosyl transferase family 2
MIGKNLKISFCTAIRNRLDHLQETLPQNILSNNEYDNLQFVILDYNSSDGLEQWIMHEMKALIEIGKVVYFKTPDPGFFHRTRSRNLVFDLAEGDILCNIDADNFTGERFAHFVNGAFQTSIDKFLTPIDDGARVSSDVLGRICVRKPDFLSIGGFDEKIEGYGFEDYDLINRLILAGLNKVIITKPEFLCAMSHDDTLRVMEEKTYHNFYKLLIHYLTRSRSDLIVLFKDGTAQRGTLIDQKSLKARNIGFGNNRKSSQYDYLLQETDWENGFWTGSEPKLEICFSNTGTIALHESKKGYFLHKTKKYYPIKDEANILAFILFHSELTNRNKMAGNLTLGPNTQRLQGSKIGKVFKNFEYDSPYLNFYFE